MQKSERQVARRRVARRWDARDGWKHRNLAGGSGGGGREGAREEVEEEEGRVEKGRRARERARLLAKRDVSGWLGGTQGSRRGVGSHGQAGWGGVKGENAKRRRGPRSIPKRRRKRLHFVFRTSPRRFRFSKMADRSLARTTSVTGPLEVVPCRRDALSTLPAGEEIIRENAAVTRRYARSRVTTPFRIPPRETSILAEGRLRD